jgi:hypothetical protein
MAPKTPSWGTVGLAIEKKMTFAFGVGYHHNHLVCFSIMTICCLSL